MKQQKALLIIDMQKGSFTPETPRYQAKEVVTRINALADMFRQSGFPVIFIQHDGSKLNEFIPHTTAWELLDELSLKSTDIFISKVANDVFYQSNLQQQLSKLNIHELFITGCATDFCVESSIQSGLARDYHITVVSDGHTTAERPHLKASKIIEHYNWVWQNMIPTKGSIKVRSMDQISSDCINNQER